MKNQQGRLARVVTMLVIGTLTVLAFSSLALAQKAKEMQDAHKMMFNGWKQFNDGQRMVIKGVEMNNLVAAQAGLEGKMAGQQGHPGRSQYRHPGSHPHCPGGKDLLGQ
jgi:hypothetical protein